MKLNVPLRTRIRVALISSALKRTQYIVEHNVFKDVGENFFFQPRILPINAKLIKIHDNVAIASNCTFVCHDVIQKVLNHLPQKEKEHFPKVYGCIEIMDNVFIGCNTTIMPNVRIGPNAIVAAGSVVTKDVPPGCVVGGVPAQVIGAFDAFVENRSNEVEFKSQNEDLLIKNCWERFYSDHRQQPVKDDFLEDLK